LISPTVHRDILVHQCLRSFATCALSIHTLSTTQCLVLVHKIMIQAHLVDVQHQQPSPNQWILQVGANSGDLQTPSSLGLKIYPGRYAQICPILHIISNVFVGSTVSVCSEHNMMHYPESMCRQSVMSHALACESPSIESLSTELPQTTYNLHLGVVISCHCMIFCMVCCLHAVVKQQCTRIG